uniref:Uncharacterized protein TCIL3000_7_5530 n=1 Tax=Trypanosoma congolense (strain IL3000) TaxID=1068625 RepID=G0UQS8_TRYCI|nr:unnamed protein product [Trypanosoma congolense IL3000]
MPSYLLPAAVVLYCFGGLVPAAQCISTTREAFMEAGQWSVNKDCLITAEGSRRSKASGSYEKGYASVESTTKDVNTRGGVQTSEACTLEPEVRDNSTSGDGKERHLIHSFRIPSLVEIDGVLIATFDTRYLHASDSSLIDTAMKYSADQGKTWKTEIIIKNARLTDNFSRVVDPTVVVKGDNLFIFVGRYNTSSTPWVWQKNGKDWDVLLYKAKVRKESAGGVPSVSFTWDEPLHLKHLLTSVGKIDGRSLIQYIGGVGNGIVTPKGTIVFPVQVLNTNKSVMNMLLYSSNDGKTWEFSKTSTPAGTTEASLVWWDGQLLLTSRTTPDVGSRKVYLTSDLGTSWNEAIGSISRVIGNSRYRNDPGGSGSSIAITVEGVPVMLVTHPENAKGRWNRDRMRLWLTDGNRMWLVGQISEGDDNSAYSYLLYTKNGTLLCLYERNIREIYSIYLARLEDEMEDIKSTVRLWKAHDELLSGDCQLNKKRRSGCTGIPITGLVGLLAGLPRKSVWPDAYNCVDASISKNNKQVSHDPPSRSTMKRRVVWPVGDQGQDQRYHFVNTHFTFVATIYFDRAPQEVSLMGFENNEESTKTLTVSIGNGRLVLTYGGLLEEIPMTRLDWSVTHQVALTLHNGEVSLHVDGNPSIANVRLKLHEPDRLLNISNLFTSTPAPVKTGKGSTVTVNNVILYNRMLNETELARLFNSRDLIDEVGDVHPVSGGGVGEWRFHVWILLAAYVLVAY